MVKFNLNLIKIINLKIKYLKYYHILYNNKIY